MSSSALLTEKKLSDRERFPELFVANPNIDRRQCKRVVPMKVLVLGLGRTGTASMWEALKQLGYIDTYHMINVIVNINDADMWREALDAKYSGKGKPYGREEWDQLLGHCQAVTDFPCASFAPELIAAYPDAKVILTNRDVDSWFKSVDNTIMKGMKRTPALRILAKFDSFLYRFIGMSDALLDGFFENDFEKNGKRRYLEHYEEVRRLVPKEKLLEYKSGDGWEPLCEFLGVQVPEQPYPKVNESAAFGDRIQLIIKSRLMATLKPLAYVAVAAGVAFAVYKVNVGRMLR